MTDNWLLNLPKKTPKTFGRALEKMAENALPPDVVRNQATKTLAKNLAAQNTPILYKRLRGYMGGKLGSGAREGMLTLEHFQTLVEYLYQKPGCIGTSAEAEAWAWSAGEAFAKALDSEWFSRLVVQHTAPAPKKPPPRYARASGMVPRTALLQHIGTKFARCLKAQAPLVVYGIPGTGKTFLMRQLAEKQSLWKDTFQDGVLTAFLEGGSSHMFLHSWVHELSGQMPPAHYSDDIVRMHLRKHLKHAHRLLLIDDVQHVDEAERLMQAHPGRSATIITTPHHTVAQKLARSKDLLLDISGFSPDETWQLYSFFCNAEVPATLRKVVTALTDLLQGNPLALQMAFFLTNAIGWEDTLTQLRHPTPETVAELESTVYLPMRLVYKLLPPAYQRSFRMLGGIRRFESYPAWAFECLWKLPPADTRRRLAVLQRHGLLQVSHDGGKPHWHLHQAVYHYAAQQLAPYPEEKKIAQTWIERAQAHPVVQKYFEKVKHYPREAIRRHYGQMIRFRLQQLPQKLWSMWKREADPTRQENDAQAFSFATIISSTSSFLCTEEYLILLKLQNESRLKRVALHPGWLFFILTTIASVALMGILLIVPIWGYLFNALALTLLTGIQCIFFLLVTFVLLPLAFREGPRLAAFHYWLSERLKQKKKCP